jgi:hypothetical protein
MMTKAAWQAHMAAEGFQTVARPGNAEALKLALAHMKSGCPTCKARRVTRKATRAARIRRETLKSLGLVQVRGGKGWE